MYSCLTILIITVTAFWMTVACYQLYRLDTTAIRSISSWLIPFVLIGYAVLLYCLPHPVMPDVPWPIVRAVHYSGIGLLFAFLIFAGICQWQMWRIFKKPGLDSLALLASIYKRWWAATKLLPAPAAFCILLSGLRLIYEDPAHGLLFFGWLFWLIASFSFFFFDGLMFYLPEVCYQFKAIEKAQQKGKTLEQFCLTHRKPLHEKMLFFHSLSFPAVFLIGCVKPGLPLPVGFANWLLSIASGCTSDSNKTQVVAAGLLVAFIGIGWLAIRLRGLIAHIKYVFGKEID